MQSKFDFERQFNAVIKKMTADILMAIGKPSALDDVQRAEFISRIAPELLKALSESGYKSLYEKDLISAADKLKQYHRLTSIPFAFSTVAKSTIKGLRATDLNKFNVIGETAIQNLYYSLKSLIVAGVSDKDYIAAVANAIDDKLFRYATTYANTARSIYYQVSEDLIATEYRAEGQELYWEYVGPADDKNRDECVFALEKGVFTDAERSEFEAEYGDESERYNCRHTFMLITDDIYKTYEKQDQDLTDKEQERRAQVLELFN